MGQATPQNNHGGIAKVLQRQALAQRVQRSQPVLAVDC
jgi:hypothetical protein